MTRPTREIIKLFEIGDTTFAEDLKAVHKAAKEILERRGAATNAMEGTEEWPGVDSIVAVEFEEDDDLQLTETCIDDGTQAEEEEHHQHAAEASTQHIRHTSTGFSSSFVNDEDLCLSGSRNTHEHFLSCATARDWFQVGTALDSKEGDSSGMESVLDKDKEEEMFSDDDELLFLI